MRYSSILPGLGALILLSAVGCSTKEPKGDADDLKQARAEAEKHRAEAERLRAELELLKKAAGDKKAGEATKYGGIEPQVVAAWEKAGTRFGWFTNVQFGVLDLIDQPSRVRPEKLGGNPAVPSFAMNIWPPVGSLETLPKPAVPFGLSFAGRKVTDGWLKELAAFPQLQALDLNWTEVSDVGMKDLAALTQLQVLYLAETKVGDAGLKDLTALKQLSILDLSGTEVTAAGVAELRRALPKVAVTAVPSK